ncbi:autotransporter-associated beta strand repeat-containing protein [Fluviibacter phosphoraccumulans]|uniref:Filamentous haemagglutinin FhaB/tRNA nuclease CdiA-like TPS domain-containing protein n=1 Tax=Fluviibacter phosphoraccumulans TaxID=1751046 RepID=A0A7R6R3L2_9RHOO|nr:autotransporter-associated beta strand repeat-containing protein [Fluviibacter phosphoraccumulans]BBU69766.1 hypothetical protein ICHIAU1_20490 [Fluviibacter phosphoraccumulans]BBU71051.1 hypothetical protein ICHIJ1_09700 [Fluviibacter phosphoraccumulans]
MKSSLNRIFKVIWSKVQMAWVAVSEAATAHGKQQSITRITRTVTTVAMLTGGAAIAAPPSPNQLPTGGQVAAGIAAIGTNGNTMTVTQTSDRAAINWNTFDIGSQAQVNFVQPSANAVALNRVNSPNPSQIYGQLSSNGQVYLINAAGVYFAPGAQVNVGGIVATTHQMSDAAFMAGSTTFDRNGSTGKVINEGTIQTSLNGYIAMLAPEVRNSGLLLAQSGTVAMAAGESITLNFGISSKLESITVTAGQLDTLVENRSAIKAPNGLIILSARAANQLAASVVNSGTIEAKGISQQGGRILLEGSTVTNTGTLDVSSDTAQAGTIQINGKNVSISGNVIATSTTQGNTNTQGGAIKVSATQSLNLTNANLNAGATNGTGGQIEFAAHQLQISDSALNADGDTRGGSIQLSATSIQQSSPFHDPLNIPTLPATLAATGFTSISSRSRRGQGGNATLTSDDIRLLDNTTINVSGATGGGNALIGGDWQGSNGVYQATTVYMGQGAIIDASATDNGNGGKVVLWSDIHNANSWTNVYGSIYAKGGANGGDGGKIETSGRAMALAGAMIDAGSVAGKAGLWLIDPYDYNIDSSAASTISSSLNSTDVLVTTSSSGGTGVVGSGSGNITISGNINKTSGAATTLTLVADNWIGGTGNIYSSGNKLSTIFNTGASQGIYSGYIYGNVSVTKLGAGTLALTYANAYTGGTQLSAGTLGIYNNSALGSGLLTAGNNTNVLFGRSVSNVANNISLTGAVTFAFDQNVEYLVVGGGAGGGGGGISSGPGYGGGGGGGGAGELKTGTLQLGGGAVAVAVGAGGTGGLNGADGRNWNGGNGTNGETSSLAGASAAGGFYGEGAGQPGVDSRWGGTGGASGAGYLGGLRVTFWDWSSGGGGGGGAGGAGTAAPNTNSGGDGGAGVMTSFAGASVTYGLGGAGGGKLAPDNTAGANGGANTGSGGGGGSGSRWSAGVGGTGGSGLVVIRYVGAAAGSGGTVSSGSGTATGYTLHSFTTVGTDTLTLNPLAVTLSGTISGAGSAIMNASGGTMTMTGTNTYTGSTNVTGGTLVVSGGLSSSTAVNVGGGAYFNIARTNTVGSIAGSGTINLGNGYTLTAGDDNNSTTFSGVISGAGSLAKSGTGTLTLTNSETYTGSTNVTAGTLVVTGYLSDSTAVNVASGATYNVSSSDTVASIAGGGTINLGSGYTLASGSSGSTTFSGVITGLGGLSKSGTGSLNLTGNNSYRGSTNVNAGTLVASHANALGTTEGGVTVVSGATLEINNVSIGGETLSLNGTGVGINGALVGTGNAAFSGNITLTNSVIIGTADTLALSGVISGGTTNVLTKSGTGSLNLTGNNSYRGATNVNAGTLVASHTNALGTTEGGVTVASGATLEINNVSVGNEALSLSGAGVGSIGALVGTGNAALSGNISPLSPASIGTADTLTLSGIIDGGSATVLSKVGSGRLTLSGNNIYRGATNVNAGTLVASHANALGTTEGGVTVASGATLEINNVSIGGETLSLSGAGVGSIGALVGTGNAAFSGNISLTNSASIGTAESLALSGVISGGTTTVLTKSGTGSLMLTGTNTYTGTTNVSAGTLQIGNGGTVGSVNGSSNISIGSGATLAFNRSDDITTANNISGAGNLTKSGINAQTLTGQATYTGLTTVSGALVFTNNVAPTTSGFAGTGTVTIQPAASSFSSDLVSNYSFASTLTGLTLGNSTNTANITLDRATSIAGNIAIYGGNVTLNNELTTTNGGIIRLQATSGSVTQGANGNITTTGLALLGGDATLTNANNRVTTLAGSGMGNLSFVNSGNLTVASVNPIGINATGVVNISTNNGDLVITEAIRTTSTATDAITLIANASAAAGTATGGNILISGNASGNISVGSGGRATLYTGSVADSTGVTALVGNGSGKFRYGSNATVSNYNTTAAALGAGVYAVYREAPTLTITANSSSITYGAAAANGSTNTAVNGDTYTQIFGSSPTFNITGSKSSSDNWVAGNHTIVADGSTTNLLGYAAPTYVNGTLTVNQATLTVTGTQVANKVYDGNTTAAVSNGNLSSVISSDSVNLSQSGSFSGKNVGTNLTVTINDSISGDDAANYVLTQPTGLTGNITKRTVTLSSNQVYSGSNVLTNVSIVTGVAGETLTYSGATANSKNVSDTTNYITGITLGNQSGATDTSGGLVSNYQLPSTTARSADNTVTITRLNSVTWTGGATGDWFDPANWAGGAVPDLNNVANVVIPGNVTVFFNSNITSPAQAGTVSIDSLGSALGNLTQTAGTLNVGTGGITLNTLTQSGGNLSSQGNVTLTTFDQSNGTSAFSGNLSTQTYNQSGGSSTVLGMLTATDYTQSNGTTTVTGNVSTTNMTLTGGTTALSGNLTTTTYLQSGGTTTTNGSLTTQTYNQSGGSSTINGMLTATDYIQSNGTTSVSGNLTTTNWTQSGGSSIALGNLTVNGSYHQTGGQTNVTGNANITTTGTMTLGNLTIGGTLHATSTAGSINQSAGSQISVTGLATFLAPAGTIVLNPNNNFPGGNSIIDQNGDRNRPKDVWVYQQTMVQGGTTVYIPLPKLQVLASKKPHKALAFTGDVVLIEDQDPENATDPGFMAQPEAGFTDRFFGTAPRITLLPETEASKLVRHGERLIIVDTDGRKLRPVPDTMSHLAR